MKMLNPRQAYVLSNLDRVELYPYKVRSKDMRTRFILDGKECTAQITALVVRKIICHLPGGGFALTRMIPRAY